MFFLWGGGGGGRLIKKNIYIYVYVYIYICTFYMLCFCSASVFFWGGGAGCRQGLEFRVSRLRLEKPDQVVQGLRSRFTISYPVDPLHQTLGPTPELL